MNRDSGLSVVPWNAGRAGRDLMLEVIPANAGSAPLSRAGAIAAYGHRRNRATGRPPSQPTASRPEIMNHFERADCIIVILLYRAAAEQPTRYPAYAKHSEAAPVVRILP
jgi:hypothetical protein